MKRTCDGCRALRWSIPRYINHSCDLGYRQMVDRNRFIPDVIPNEECPKPRTYKALHEARRVIRVAR
jgi:hypothetical protein